MLKVNGAELGFEVRGSGPDVVFVQGVGLTGAAWSPQIDELARDHRCIALDNRGIGKSTGDTSKLSVDLMARDALALMDALELSRAHLVGVRSAPDRRSETCSCAPCTPTTNAASCTSWRGSAPSC